MKSTINTGDCLRSLFRLVHRIYIGVITTKGVPTSAQHILSRIYLIKSLAYHRVVISPTYPTYISYRDIAGKIGIFEKTSLNHLEPVY